MICPICGRTLPDDSEFCQYCGRKIKDERKKEHIPSKNYEYTNTAEEITSSSKNIKSCQKQYHHLARALRFSILVVLMLASVGLNIYQYITLRKTQVTIMDLRNNIAEKERTVSDQLSTIISQKKTINKQSSEITDLEDEISYLNSDYWELNFYHEHACIVPDDGSLFYHNYDCIGLDLSSFWIYNIEEAEYLGYYPCPRCH